MIYDLYRLKADVDKKCCYTCKKHRTTECGVLSRGEACKYALKDDVRGAVKGIKPLFGR